MAFAPPIFDLMLTKNVKCFSNFRLEMTTCTLFLALRYSHWKMNRIIFALRLSYVNRIRSMPQLTCMRKPIQRLPKRSTQKSTLIPVPWTETAEATYPNPNPNITWLSAHQLAQVATNHIIVYALPKYF